MGFPQSDQFLIIVEDRILTCQLLSGVDPGIVGIYHDPGGGGTETCVVAVIPLHGRSGVVAALIAKVAHHIVRSDLSASGVFMKSVDTLDIPEIRKSREGYIGHAKLFSLIDIGRALHHMETGRQHLRRTLPVNVAVVAQP